MRCFDAFGHMSQLAEDRCERHTAREP
jgi:hypothetical protein